MSDLAYLLARLRRMTVAEWTHGLACMAVIVTWTIVALAQP